MANLGKAVYYDASHLGKFERGERVPPPHVVQECDRVLEAAGELVRLYALVLAAEPAAARVGSAGRSREDTSAPHLADRPRAQLPTEVAGFTGRTRQLAQLDAVLEAVGTSPGPVAISAISGTAGVGKTALAVHWAHRVAGQFPDGQLYVNLRGYSPSSEMKPAMDAVRGFLEALGMSAESVPTDLDNLVAMYRSLTSGKRMLIVIDNARDSDHVRPLIPGSPSCLVVVTSRSHLSSLMAIEGAHAVNLEPFSDSEAQEFLRNRLGKDRVSVEPQTIDEIITSCARLPLALAVVSARAAEHPGFPLRALSAELSNTQALDAFRGAEPTSDIRSVFSWSYRLLTQRAARLFRGLGLVPVPDISVPAAASIDGVDLHEAARLLSELSNAHLVSEHMPNRYTFHDLLRVYARELALAFERKEERDATVGRLIDHYLHSAYGAAMLLHPQRQSVDLSPPQPGVVPEVLEDYQRALEWFRQERPMLVALSRLSVEEGCDDRAWKLAWTLTEFLDLQGYWQDMIATYGAVLKATEHQANSWRQAESHRSLATAYLRMQRPGQARNHFRSALVLSAQIADAPGVASSYLGLARVSEEQGRPSEGLGYARNAYSILLCEGQQRLQVEVLNRIGWYLTLLGDYRHALHACRKALVVLSGLDFRYGQAATYDSLGYIHYHLGEHRRAIAYYSEALSVFREVRDRYLDAAILTRLGDAFQANQDWSKACAAWQDALDILRELGHPTAEAVEARLSMFTTTASARANEHTNGQSST